MARRAKRARLGRNRVRSFKFVVLAGLMSLGLSFPLLAGDDTVEWLSNYKDAIQEAKRTQKPIFLEYRCEA
jgi:hypothetical protein